MAAKMTAKQWEKARKLWEADARPGYSWLQRELNLPVSRVAVSRRAKAEGWEKRAIEEQSAPPSVEPEVTQAVTVTPEVTQEVTPVTKGRGRPSEYRPEYAEQAERLCLLGFTREKLAAFFEVDERTIYRWQQQHEDFRHAIWRGGALADAEVAHALFHRATGAVVPETHVSNYQGEVTLTDMERHYPPETAAARLWLKNRQPEFWKDKVELEEKPVIALVDKEAMRGRIEAALEKAAQVEREMRGRAERLGLMLDDGTYPDTGSTYVADYIRSQDDE